VAKESQMDWMASSHDEAGFGAARERSLLLADHAAGLAGAFGVSPAPVVAPAPDEVDDFTAWSLCPNCRVGAVHLLGERLHTPTGRGRFQTVVDLPVLSLDELLADVGADKAPIALPHSQVWHDEMLESVQRECRSCRHVWSVALGWTWVTS
jgi:hypothetical protein